MKLRYSSASPYVRKVTVLAIETGLDGRIEWVPTDVWDPSTDLPGDNPLGKVPTLITDGGEALYDSPVICEFLDTLHDGLKLFPPPGGARWTALRRQALADGVLDAGIARRLEALRPEKERSASWSAKQAAVVDRKFEDYAGSANFYTLYRIHNVHFVAYGAMFIGRKSQALDAAGALRQLLPVETVAFLPDFFEAFWGIRLHVLIRFGMWQEILDEPMPEDAELFSFTTALQHYARTVALANLGRIAEAQEEIGRFHPARAAVQETRYMFNNPAENVLVIADHMAKGELAYKSGRIDEGLDRLRDAVIASDGLLYDEPWGWMQPPRHALAALLLDQGRHAEAEAIYRADLGLDDTLPRAVQHPRNVWSLHGLDECLGARGETVERPHVQALLSQALARSEVAVRSSCYCRTAA